MLRLGHFPDAASDELCSHIVECRSCTELVSVESALRADRSRAMASAPVKSAGLVWWRAQLRKREQALVEVGRPLWGAQIFSAFLGLVMALVFLVWEVKQGSDPLQWIRSAGSVGTILSAILNAWGWQSLLGMTSAVTILAGFVVYFAWSLRHERD